MLPPSSSDAPDSSASVGEEEEKEEETAFIAWSLRNGIHSMSVATDSFTSPSTRIIIHNDILPAMLLLPGGIV
jgi:uncharacterized protein YijF (DUF1287 family)